MSTRWFMHARVHEGPGFEKFRALFSFLFIISYAFHRSLLWWQPVANAITLLEGEREREEEETFNNVTTKKKREEIFSDVFWKIKKKRKRNLVASLLRLVVTLPAEIFVFLLSDDCRSLPYFELWIERSEAKWRGEEEDGKISIK